MKVKLPKVGYAFRFIGKGLAEGTLQRVLFSSPEEIVTVQDSCQPNWSWLGTPKSFWEQFVFVYGPAPSGGRLC